MHPTPARHFRLHTPTFIAALPVRTTKLRACPRRCVSCRTISMTSDAAAGRLPLLGGTALLSALLINRLVFTPLDTLALSQSRSDIVGVVSAATLVLYGVGRADIAARTRDVVELDGFDVRQGFEEGGEAEWLMECLMGGNANVRSCALFVGEVGTYFIGRFRERVVDGKVVPGGVVDLARREGRRVYLADLRTVPVKEVEFGYLPRECQAVIVQPMSEEMVLVLGADKARPFQRNDFGWLQAIADRLATVCKP